LPAELDDTSIMMQGQNSGRRNSMRVRCGLKVDVQADPGPICAEILNISQKGYFLQANEKSSADVLQRSSSLSLTAPLRLVLKFYDEPREVVVPCEVAWKSDLGVGISYENPPERLKDFIS